MMLIEEMRNFLIEYYSAAGQNVAEIENMTDEEIERLYFEIYENYEKILRNSNQPF